MGQLANQGLCEQWWVVVKMTCEWVFVVKAEEGAHSIDTDSPQQRLVSVIRSTSPPKFTLGLPDVCDEKLTRCLYCHLCFVYLSFVVCYTGRVSLFYPGICLAVLFYQPGKKLPNFFAGLVKKNS